MYTGYATPYRPWFLQPSYISIVLLMLGSPFLFLPGQKPLLCMVVIAAALYLQTVRQLNIISVKKPPELLCYTLWAFWALGTGCFVFNNSFLFVDALKQLIRMTVMLWAFFAIFYRQRDFRYVFVTIIVVALIQIVATRLGYQIVGLELVQDTIDPETQRIEGLTGNANAMGFSMLSGIWASMMLWRNDGSRSMFFKRILLLIVIAVFSFFLIRTASRKSMLVEICLLSGWLIWMVPGRFSFKSVFIAGAMAIVVFAIGTSVIGYVMEDTLMGQRFDDLLTRGGGSVIEGYKANIRYWMYVDGWRMFTQHPIAGVGLGQFGVYFVTGQYSHSDYMEPLACTGLIGFMLYHGFALVVTARILKLLHCRLPNESLYSLKGMLLYMVGNHYLIGVGAPHWNITDHNMVVMLIGVATWKLWLRVSKNAFIYET